MPALNGSDILEHLQARHDYGVALLELSRRQHGRIAERDFSELIDLLSRKQRILGRLDALKQKQPVIAEEWERQRNHLTPDVRNRCESLLQRTESLYADLLAEEERCQTALQQSRDEVGRELQDVSNSRDVHRAYGTAAAEETSLLDLDR